MPKKSRKVPQIMIDEKNGHLFYGDDHKIRLLMMSPLDLIEFCEFGGVNADDILIWVGKTVAKYLLDNIFPGIDWNSESLSAKKEVVNEMLEDFELLGYGTITSIFKKNVIFFKVEDPMSDEESDNIMAKNICFIYEGLCNGILESLGIDVESKELFCYLLADEACVFKMDLLIDEFDDIDIDADDTFDLFI